MPSNNFIESVFLEYGWLGAIGLLVLFFSWVQIRERNSQIAFQDKVNTAYFEERRDNMLRAEKYAKEMDALHQKVLELTELMQLRAETYAREKQEQSDQLHALRNELELALRRLDDCEDRVKVKENGK